MTLSGLHANLSQNQQPYQQPTYYIPNNNKVAFARLTTVASAFSNSNYRLDFIFSSVASELEEASRRDRLEFRWRSHSRELSGDVSYLKHIRSRLRGYQMNAAEGGISKNGESRGTWMRKIFLLQE